MYLEDRIFDLKFDLGVANPADEAHDDDNIDASGSQEPICTSPYCSCPCHKNKRSPPPPPPTPIGGYYEEGATHFAMWWWWWEGGATSKY